MATDKTVRAVAFAFLDPEALRIFLRFKGFNVTVASGDASVLKGMKPNGKNIVILPNFAKRHVLAEHAAAIDTVLLLTNGKHDDIVSRGIPMLDATLQDGVLVEEKPRTPHWYIDKIQTVAVPLVLDDDPLPKKKKPEVETAVDVSAFDSLDHWLSYIDEQKCAGVRNFAVDIEHPVCLYLVGEMSRSEFKSALKALTKRGADKNLLQAFYRWVDDDYAERMQQAMTRYLKPKNTDKIPSVFKLAKKFKVASVDIELLEAITAEIKGVADEQEE